MARTISLTLTQVGAVVAAARRWQAAPAPARPVSRGSTKMIQFSKIVDSQTAAVVENA